MRFCEKSFYVMLLSGILLFGFVDFALAKQPITVPLVSAPFGTGQYVLGTAIEDISKKYHPWLRISTTESPGLVYNIKMIAKDSEAKETKIINSADSILWFAQEGRPPLGQVMGEDLRILGYSHGLLIWFASLDPDIKTVKDLEGKKVALGTKAQIGWGLMPNWILEVGAQLEGKANTQWVGLESAKTALLDGFADAMPVGVYLNTVDYRNIPTPKTRELLATGKKVYHLPFTKDMASLMSKELGYDFKSVVVPAGTFQGIDQEISGLWGGGNFWAASEQFPEDLAYEFTKLLIENCEKLKDYHVLGELTARSEVLCEGATPESLHPGAYRAYREAGLMN